MARRNGGAAANARLNGEYAAKVSRNEKRHTAKIRRAMAQAQIAEATA